jgi:hypothetical protein
VNTSATGSSRVCNFTINSGSAAVPTRFERKFHLSVQDRVKTGDWLLTAGP